MKKKKFEQNSKKNSPKKKNDGAKSTSFLKILKHRIFRAKKKLSFWQIF